MNLCHLAAFLLCLFQHLFLHFHLAISIWPESDRNILCLDSDFLDDLPADRIFLSFCLLENWLEAVQIQPEIKNKFFSSVLSLNNHNQKIFILFATEVHLDATEVDLCAGSRFQLAIFLVKTHCTYLKAIIGISMSFKVSHYQIIFWNYNQKLFIVAVWRVFVFAGSRFTRAGSVINCKFSCENSPICQKNSWKHTWKP